MQFWKIMRTMTSMKVRKKEKQPFSFLISRGSGNVADPKEKEEEEEEEGENEAKKTKMEEKNSKKGKMVKRWSAWALTSSRASSQDRKYNLDRLQP